MTTIWRTRRVVVWRVYYIYIGWMHPSSTSYSIDNSYVGRDNLTIYSFCANPFAVRSNTVSFLYSALLSAPLPLLAKGTGGVRVPIFTEARAPSWNAASGFSRLAFFLRFTALTVFAFPLVPRVTGVLHRGYVIRIGFILDAKIQKFWIKKQSCKRYMVIRFIFIKLIEMIKRWQMLV